MVCPTIARETMHGVSRRSASRSVIHAIRVNTRADMDASENAYRGPRLRPASPYAVNRVTFPCVKSGFLASGKAFRHEGDGVIFLD